MFIELSVVVPGVLVVAGLELVVAVDTIRGGNLLVDGF